MQTVCTIIIAISLIMTALSFKTETEPWYLDADWEPIDQDANKDQDKAA